jgi:hypothetical protein
LKALFQWRRKVIIKQVKEHGAILNYRKEKNSKILAYKYALTTQWGKNFRLSHLITTVHLNAGSFLKYPVIYR